MKRLLAEHRLMRSTVTAVIATTVMLAALAGTASAGPHLDADRVYTASLPKGAGSLKLYAFRNRDGSDVARQGHLAVYCGGTLARVSYPFDIVSRERRGGVREGFESTDVFSSVWPFPPPGQFDFDGKVVQRGGVAVPRLTLTMGGPIVQPCPGLTSRTVKKWKRLRKSRDNRFVNDIRFRRFFQPEIFLDCPASSEMGEQVTILGSLEPDAAGTPIQINERSSLEASGSGFTRTTFSTGFFNFTFTPQPGDSGVSYTQTLSASFGGDEVRLPNSASCSWPVLAS